MLTTTFINDTKKMREKKGGKYRIAPPPPPRDCAGAVWYSCVALDLGCYLVVLRAELVISPRGNFVLISASLTGSLLNFGFVILDM